MDSPSIRALGSTPVTHFQDYEKYKFAYICEVIFTRTKQNFCYRDKAFYQAHFNNITKKFDLLPVDDTTWNRTWNFSAFQSRPVSVIYLADRYAILFEDHFMIDGERTEYSNLFLNHNVSNRIRYAYFDEITKRYLFIGSEFNFIFDHLELNEQNRFILPINKLTQPIFGHCLTYIEHNTKAIALLSGILSSFVLSLMIICLIYLKLHRQKRAFAKRISQKSVKALNQTKKSLSHKKVPVKS